MVSIPGIKIIARHRDWRNSRFWVGTELLFGTISAGNMGLPVTRAGHFGVSSGRCRADIHAMALLFWTFKFMAYNIYSS
jgi:hypothetical protein